MRYVSIDIESSGLDPERDQILEIGAVIEDTDNPVPVDQLPSFSKIILHERIEGDPFALAMNADLIKEIAEHPNTRLEGKYFSRPDVVAGKFLSWLLQNGFEGSDARGSTQLKIVAAGKNFSSFDRPFLVNAGILNDRVRAHHRVLDPGTLFFDPTQDDVPPDTQTCMERAGISGEVTHRALDDAKVVVRLIRHGLGLPDPDA